MLDSDLAELFAVTTMAFNQAIKRNLAKFPKDFLFQLTREEVAHLKSQIVISSSTSTGRTPREHGGRRKLPLAFTEHGAIMAASIINTSRAVDVSIFVVQAFVKLRQFAVDHKEILKKLSELERKVGGHDEALKQIVQALKQLMTPATDGKPKRRIGFHAATDENPKARAKK